MEFLPPETRLMTSFRKLLEKSIFSAFSITLVYRLQRYVHNCIFYFYLKKFIVIISATYISLLSIKNSIFLRKYNDFCIACLIFTRIQQYEIFLEIKEIQDRTMFTMAKLKKSRKCSKFVEIQVTTKLRDVEFGLSLLCPKTFHTKEFFFPFILFLKIFI